ncbi:hypothetical protein CPB86DRAFT_561922, partial [Serendipita vermifera]
TQAEVLTSQKEIHRLDGPIADIKRQITELQARLAPLQRERDNHASYISPFRCLPVEIALEIIDHCREWGASLRVLLKICGSFRDVILATPKLWNKVRIRVGARHFYDVRVIGMEIRLGLISLKRYNRDMSLEQLDFTLKHADSIPLDLSMDLAQGDGMPSTLDLISSRQCLIRSLKISGYGGIDDSSYELIIKKLNIGSLKNFCLLGDDSDRARRVMDLVMQASQGRMAIDVQINTRDLASILQHSLLQRADKLSISSSESSFTCVSQINPIVQIRLLHRLQPRFPFRNYCCLHKHWHSHPSNVK